MQVTIMQGRVDGTVLVGIEIGRLTSRDNKVYYGLIAPSGQHLNVSPDIGWVAGRIPININEPFKLSDLNRPSCRHGMRGDVLTPATEENKQKFLTAYPELRKYIIRGKSCR